LEPPRQPPTSRSGLLPEARHVVVPEGIVASGFPAVRETCHRIGIDFDPWQRDLNTLILAKSADGMLAADTVAMSICRQAGKTFDVGGLVFADSIIHPGTTSVWTAHRFKVARESFDSLRAMARSPLMAPHIDFDAITTAAGNEVIPFRNGSRIVFAARERGTIRGFSKVRRLILDEGQILTESAMADLAPTMNQAHDPQIIIMGTPPKPSDPGEFFTGLRATALEGSSDGLLYVEFGAEPGSDPDDPATWARANPSFPHRTSARAIRRLRKLLTSDDDFAREALGIWDTADGQRGFPAERWLSLADPGAPRARPVAFGVATAPDHSWSAVAVAWRRPDQDFQVMLADYRQSSEWLADRVAELRATWGGSVVADSASRGLVDAEFLSEPKQAEAENALEALVKAGGVHHGNEPAMNTAARGARGRLREHTRVLDRKGDVEISPIRAAALAVHALVNAPTSSGWMVGV
jgi:phage terminase large subunit-like protein